MKAVIRACEAFVPITQSVDAADVSVAAHTAGGALARIGVRAATTILRVTDPIEPGNEQDAHAVATLAAMQGMSEAVNSAAALVSRPWADQAGSLT